MVAATSHIGLVRALFMPDKLNLHIRLSKRKYCEVHGNYLHSHSGMNATKVRTLNTQDDDHSREYGYIMKGMAIICIMLHNYCHLMPGATQENEFIFSYENHYSPLKMDGVVLI